MILHLLRHFTVNRVVGGLTLLVTVSSGVANAQRADTARVAARPKVDTTRSAPQPPLSPRRAFLYSLVAPGYAQSRLGRPIGGALFVFTESIAIAMLRESAADLREARLFRRDTLEYIGNDPGSGSPVMHRNSYNDELISIRRGHVEDWIAFLIANHLFAGADAYVAAHLWDLPSQISVTPTTSGTVVAARIRW
ncbi:MAG: hypothetical protein ABI969_04290 [bacterium]